MNPLRDFEKGLVWIAVICFLTGLSVGIFAGAMMEHNGARTAACLATKCAAGEPLYVESRCLCAVDAGAKP